MFFKGIFFLLWSLLLQLIIFVFLTNYFCFKQKLNLELSLKFFLGIIVKVLAITGYTNH